MAVPFWSATDFPGFDALLEMAMFAPMGDSDPGEDARRAWETQDATVLNRASPLDH
jgi:hypothetical protein